MSEARSLVARVYDLINARRFDGLGEVMHADAALVLSDGTRLEGLAAVADYSAALGRAVPDVRWELERVLAESEDTIVTRTRVVRLEDGPELRLPQDRVSVALCVVSRITGGRIGELQIYSQGDSRLQSAGSDRLLAEQSAMQGVATLVARGAPQSEVFEAVVAEAVKLLGTETWLLRLEAEGGGTIVAQHGAAGLERVEAADLMLGGGILELTRRRGRPSRLDGYAGLTGPGPDRARRLGVVGSAAAPLFVQGTMWGALIVVSRGPPLQSGIEDRLALFADCAATAIANAQSRAELELLVAEQAGLRRVADLVARGAASQEVFDAVTVEAGRLMGGVAISLARHDQTVGAVFVAQSGEPLPARIPAARAEAWIERVRHTRPAVRIDDFDQVPDAETNYPGIRAAVGAPIVVAGQVWGTLAAYSPHGPLPAGTEERLSAFAELVATAERRAALARYEAELTAERNRLGRELHDVLAHTLGAASIQLTALDSRVAARDAPASVRERIGAIHRLVGDGLGEARAAVRALREDDLLLDRQLARLCELHGAAFGVQGEARSLGPETTLTLYRVAQEALTNVDKHAPKAAVSVQLLFDVEVVGVRIDNGHSGMEAAGPLASSGGGYGLAGMRERVQLTGGSLEAGPTEDGWRVCAMVPGE